MVCRRADPSMFSAPADEVLGDEPPWYRLDPDQRHDQLSPFRSDATASGPPLSSSARSSVRGARLGRKSFDDRPDRFGIRHYREVVTTQPFKPPAKRAR